MKKHKFDHRAIEEKWQQKWHECGLYDVGERNPAKEKEYVLVEWPYPSGNLHIGHWYAFAVPDIYVRMRRMQGVQALFPMGFDAFGLPAENAAIKRDVNPREWTEENIAYMRTQLASMGNAFSWDKTTSSTDLDYYKWTQWMFTKFFENDIAYRGTGIVNWCPSCSTVLANEQVASDDTCERCDTTVEKREMEEWKMRITDYADRLVDDLDALDWPEHIKDAQRNWIGKSEGAELQFKIKNEQSEAVDEIPVFTTRPDTLFGATYLVLAPEHPFVKKQTHDPESEIQNTAEVTEYVQKAIAKSEQDRLNETKEKTGVELKGVRAVNPASGEEIPIFVADYVLASYGTGAIMAVPAHDERDHAFVEKFDIPIRIVIAQHFDDIKEDVETIDRGDVVDLLIEHPTDGTFLLQREKSDTGDHVHFVGGGTEGESHEIAIGRELLEETGFTDYEIVSSVIHIHTAHIYRHTKDKNQLTKSYFYHIKLRDLDQKPSEIEEGRHTVEWVNKKDIEKAITWASHREAWRSFVYGYVFTGSGTLVNSDEFNGMDSQEAKTAITQKVGGTMTNTYRLRDWSVGRQRYWGAPIPIVYDPEGTAHPVPEEHLPWQLPADVDVTPTGEPPLAKSKELKERTERIFGEGWTPEVETMDTFLDSSWYFLRYIDNQNDQSAAALERQKEWMPVDIYFGGAEHTTMHLLYSRFWQKALYDLGYVTDTEPYKKRINRGLILGPDGNKMSKSKGNIIDPDKQLEEVGADAVKMYLAFMGPYQGSNYPWDMGGIAGIRRFLERVHELSEYVGDTEETDVTRTLHKTIQKVGEDIASYKFNTAISALMILANTIERSGCTEETYKNFLRLLAPFAPHLAEELWERAGGSFSIHMEPWPETRHDLLIDDEITLGVQIDGKFRGTVTTSADASEEDVLAVVEQDANLSAKFDRDNIARIVYVPGKIMNIIRN